MMNKYLKTFENYRYLLEDLVVRDFKLKYRRSVLGFLWSVLNPLLMMLVMTAVFQNMFKNSIQNFAVYYLCGYLIFNFVLEATNGALVSIVQSGGLMKKVYLPKYIFPLEKCLFSLVNILFSSVALIIVIIFIKMPIPNTIILFPIPLIYSLVFSIGLGLILATMNVFFRDIGHLYSVWTTAWMYFTPLFYPIESIPMGIQKIIMLNPLYYYVEYMRKVIMYGQVPDIKMNLICIIYALVFFLVGIILFRKNQDKFILFI